MEITVLYPGSIGEIVQGKYRDKDVLLSCPVNLFTKVTLLETKNPENKYSYYKSQRFLKNILEAWDYKKYERNIDIKIQSEIPYGKGFASSTADLCAVYYGLLKLFNKSYNEEELIRECIKVEPTDSIIFNELTVFDYKKGLYRKSIGQYLEFHLLVFEGNKCVDTIEFNKLELPALYSIDDLINILAEDCSIKNIAKVATKSIIRNQHRLQYNILTEILKFQDETGGLGVIGAHSGDVLAIVYDNEQDLDSAMKNIKWFPGYKIYKCKSVSSEQMKMYTKN